MNRPNRDFRMWRGAFLGTLVLCASAGFAQDAGLPHETARISGPEEMRDELWLAQFLAPPCGGEQIYEAGVFLFVPDGADPDADRFAAGLLSDTGAAGQVSWPVTVFEERETRDTVFWNADGGEILRLPPAPDYDALWILDGLYPEGAVPDGVASAYDPARVVMTARLLPPGSVREENRLTTAGTGGRTGPALAAGRSFAPAVSGKKPSDSGSEDDDADRDGVSDGTEIKRGTNPADPFSRSIVLYADSDRGSDAYDGLSPVVRGSGHGPKATVQQAINASVSGDVIEISGQAVFSEDGLDARGKDVTIRPVGAVSFGRAGPGKPRISE